MDGQRFTLTVTVTDVGTRPVFDVSTSGPYPDAVDVEDRGCGAAAGSLGCPFGTIAPGRTAVRSATFRALRPGRIDTTMTLVIGGLVDGTHPASATVTVTVTAAPPTTVGAAAGRLAPCRSSQLHLDALDEPIPGPTGHLSVGLALTNTSASSPCRLLGYPQVAIRDASGSVLPFEYDHDGDMVIAPSAPAPVALAPGATAFVAIDHYRCDTGATRHDATISLTPPDDTDELDRVADPRPGFFDYCGVNDPGSTITVSPIASTWPAALGRR